MYKTIAVLAEVSLVWSLGLLGRGIRPLRAAHLNVVSSLRKAADLLQEESLPASLRFGVWLSELLLHIPQLALGSSLAVLGGLAFSPASLTAQFALLSCVILTFLALSLFTFFNRRVIYDHDHRNPVEPSP